MMTRLLLLLLNVQVRATDARCANNKRGDYQDGTSLVYSTPAFNLPVMIGRYSGHVCLSTTLNYDLSDLYEFKVNATNQGHLHLTFQLL